MFRVAQGFVKSKQGALTADQMQCRGSNQHPVFTSRPSADVCALKSRKSERYANQAEAEADDQEPLDHLDVRWQQTDRSKSHILPARYICDWLTEPKVYFSARPRFTFHSAMKFTQFTTDCVLS